MNLRGYHLHLYCQPQQIPLAQAIRESLVTEVKEIEGAGPVRSGPIGPHPLPMFEAWFQPEAIAQVLPWILKNRNGLSVLIHPITGDDYRDHEAHALWIGDKLPLNFAALKD